MQRGWILLVTIIIFISGCCAFFGSHKLGGNLFLLEGDNIKDRIIVFCVGKDKQGCCYSGSCIIPKYHMNNEGRYAEYVEIAKSNRKWVIVKTYQIFKMKNNYWIVDKSFDENVVSSQSITSSYLIGPLDSVQFYQKVKDKGIKLKFE